MTRALSSTCRDLRLPIAVQALELGAFVWRELSRHEQVQEVPVEERCGRRNNLYQLFNGKQPDLV